MTTPATKKGFSLSRLNFGRLAVIGIPFGWLLLFFVIPFLIVLKISVSESDGVRFADLLTYSDGLVQLKIKLSNYLFLATDDLYLISYWSSIKYAFIAASVCLFLAYPFAYFMARSPLSWRPALIMLVMLPFWTSILLRVYAWKGLLDNSGIFNQMLIGLGIIDAPIKMLHTPFSLVVGMVYAYIPFMILPLYATLSKLDGRLLEAAADLGARPWTAFWKVTVPLSKSGIVAGFLLVFIPCVGEFVIPAMLGGPETPVIGRVLWDEFFSNNDWPMASAVAVVVILLLLIPLGILNRAQADAAGRATDS